jgi:hypothetical protein
VKLSRSSLTKRDLLLTNVSIYNSQSRIAPFRSALIVNAGPANVTLHNVRVLIFGSLFEDQGQIEWVQSEDCTPTDDHMQFYELKDSYWSMPENEGTVFFQTFF